ncbi:MAG: DNA repair protein RecO [Clostridiales bacterium]|jgi:DNA repair protein RecO (recombination protein O)|nr:DNA repair protein RecO [Clostridiales bacterium]
MTITVKGLIIKETIVGEANKIITILTPELGKIQAGAHGARSHKSKLIAGCQMFCYTAFVLTKKGDRYYVTSAEPYETFYALRLDLEKLALAAYFCDLLCGVTTDLHGAGEAARLALNTFYILTRQEGLPLIKAVFELRLMSLSGFAPELSSCVLCGADGGLTGFSVNDGGTLCGGCKQGGALSPGALAAMRHIVRCEPKRLFSFTVSGEVLETLAVIAENYALSVLGRRPRSLKYYLTISQNML